MLHKIIAGVFILFAAFQYNDPDFFIWVPIYLIITMVIVLFDRQIFNLRLTQLLLILYVIGMFTYYPDVVSWIKNDTPSITGSMKAESPFIEFIREFFGLFICSLTLAYYAYLMSSRQKS